MINQPLLNMAPANNQQITQQQVEQLLQRQQNLQKSNPLPQLASNSLPQLPQLTNLNYNLPNHNLFQNFAQNPVSLPPTTTATPTNIPFSKLPGNKACLICGDRATGLHYGIISCEGCKGFFKRSICNRRIYKCSRGGSCEMSRKQRNRCQYCRLKKCLKVGMNRKAIREDGMPGGRNKNIGAVNLSDEEISRVLTGQEYRETSISPSVPFTHNGNSNSNGQTSSSSSINIDVETPQLHPATATAMPATMPAAMSAAQLQQPALSRREEMIENLKRLHQERQKAQIEASILAEKAQQTRDKQLEIDLKQAELTFPDACRMTKNLIDNECLEEIDCLLNLEGKTSINKDEILMLLAKMADEMLVRQTRWIKSLPFYGQIMVKDHITLLSQTWPELNLLAAFTLHKSQAIYGKLSEMEINCASDETFNPDELETIERILRLFQKMNSLKIDLEEYVILKAINFLNHQIPNLENPASIESINKTYWYQTQAYVELRYKIKQAHYNYFNQMQSNQPDANNPDNVRFRELMLCLPEIRHLAVKLQNIGLDKVPLLLKAVIQTIKITTKNESCIQTVKKVKNFTVPDSKNLNLGSGNVCTNASLKVKHENLSNQISENSLSESLKRPSSSSDNEAAQILSSLKHDVPIAKRPRASSGKIINIQSCNSPPKTLNMSPINPDIENNLQSTKEEVLLKLCNNSSLMNLPMLYQNHQTSSGNSSGDVITPPSEEVTGQMRHQNESSSPEISEDEEVDLQVEAGMGGEGENTGNSSENSAEQLRKLNKVNSQRELLLRNIPNIKKEI